MGSNQEQKLAELTRLANADEVLGGENVFYNYENHDGNHILTLEEALAICGPYIAPVPSDIALNMLRQMQTSAHEIQTTSTEQFLQGRLAGRQVLARYVLKKES